MNRTQAIAKLRTILGKHLAYRENPKALTGEDREAAGPISVAANAAEASAKIAMNARHSELLKTDPEYQRLRAAYLAAHAESGKASGNSYRRRITVGTSEGMFFHVRAEGDNWQEVVDILTKKKEAA